MRELALGQKPAGYYVSRERAAYWDGKNEPGEGVASGVYLYELVTPGFRQMRRLVVVK